MSSTPFSDVIRGRYRSDVEANQIKEFVQDVSFAGPATSLNLNAKYLDKWFTDGPLCIRFPPASCYRNDGPQNLHLCGHSHFQFKAMTLPNFTLWKWHVGMTFCALYIYAQSILPCRTVFSKHKILFIGLPPFPWNDPEYIRMANREQGTKWAHRIIMHMGHVFASDAALKSLAPNEPLNSSFQYQWDKGSDGTPLRVSMSSTGHVVFKQEDYLVRVLRFHHAKLCALNQELVVHWSATTYWGEIIQFQHLFNEQDRSLVNQICRAQRVGETFVCDRKGEAPDWSEEINSGSLSFHYLRYTDIHDYYRVISSPRTKDEIHSPSPSSIGVQPPSSETHTQEGAGSPTLTSSSLYSSDPINSDDYASADRFLDDVAATLLREPSVLRAVETTVKGSRQRQRQTATSSFLGKGEERRCLRQIRRDIGKMVDSKTGLTLDEWRAEFINPTAKSPPPSGPPNDEAIYADGYIPGVEEPSDEEEDEENFEMVEAGPVLNNDEQVSD